MEDKIKKVLEKSLKSEISVANLQMLKGGYSREMWSFDVVSNVLSGRLILCSDSDQGVVEEGSQSLSREQEFKLLRYLSEKKLIVPKVYCCGGKESDIGKPFYIMEHVSGLTALGPLIKDPVYSKNSKLYANQLAQALVDLHNIDFPINSEEIFPRNIPEINDDIEIWKSAYMSISEIYSSTFNDAYVWLSKNIPESSDKPCIVHGDFRTGNVIYNEREICSIIDWEMAHIGYALEDLAWAEMIIWQVGTGKASALVDVDEWISIYENKSGHQVNKDHYFFWQIFSIFKMGSLAYKSVLITENEKEKELLTRLFNLLESDLANKLNSIN